MTAKLIDGRAAARHFRADYRRRIENLRQTDELVPGLAVILVGDDPASRVYVRHKIAACQDVGIRSVLVELPSSTSTTTVLERIDDLNRDPDVHGILVQLPLPPQIDATRILNRIAVSKDVDGFHPVNAGDLMAGTAQYPPCTPFGIQKLLEYERIPVSGQNVVMVGSSKIVGRPAALMFMQQGATVSICNSRTRDLAQFTGLADILVVAVGVPGLITEQMVRHGVVVVDVGINRRPDGGIVGDVDFSGVRRKASYITPVPGGVGPMTVTMLLHNTLVSAECMQRAGTIRRA